jgi:hypothetical protein
MMVVIAQDGHSRGWIFDIQMADDQTGVGSSCALPGEPEVPHTAARYT